MKMNEQKNWYDIMNVIIDTKNNDVWNMIHQSGKQLQSHSQNGFQYLYKESRKFPLLYQKATHE